MKSGLWPVTVIIVAFLAAISIILSTTPATDQATRSIVIVLISTMGSLLSAVWINKRNEEVTNDVLARIAAVQKQVNGNTGRLLDNNEALIARATTCTCQHADPPGTGSAPIT